MNAAVWDQVQEAFMGTEAAAYRNGGFSGVKIPEGMGGKRCEDAMKGSVQSPKGV